MTVTRRKCGRWLRPMGPIMIDTKSLREMPSSLNDACRTMDAAADEIERLRAGWEEFSGVTPVDKPVMLWFIGNNAPKAAHACAIGAISSHEPGFVWIDGNYRPIEWFSHWRLLPAGPQRS